MIQQGLIWRGVCGPELFEIGDSGNDALVDHVDFGEPRLQLQDNVTQVVQRVDVFVTTFDARRRPSRAADDEGVAQHKRV